MHNTDDCLDVTASLVSIGTILRRERPSSSAVGAALDTCKSPLWEARVPDIAVAVELSVRRTSAALESGAMREARAGRQTLLLLMEAVGAIEAQNPSEWLRNELRHLYDEAALDARSIDLRGRESGTGWRWGRRRRNDPPVL